MSEQEDLGREYLRKMVEPRMLSAEDQEQIRNLLRRGSFPLYDSEGSYLERE